MNWASFLSATSMGLCHCFTSCSSILCRAKTRPLPGSSRFPREQRVSQCTNWPHEVTWISHGLMRSHTVAVSLSFPTSKDRGTPADGWWTENCLLACPTEQWAWRWRWLPHISTIDQTTAFLHSLKAPRVFTEYIWSDQFPHLLLIPTVLRCRFTWLSLDTCHYSWCPHQRTMQALPDSRPPCSSL